MAGTSISVIKNANAKPKIIVQLSGFQKTTLSPPKKICGSKSENRVTKLILKPTAMGMKARMAANAVSNTGIIRVLPACMMASFVFIPRLLNSSANSITRIPFFTTIPARPTIPNPVISTDTSIPVIAKPSSTPITLKIISVRMMMGLLTLLNCITSTNKITIKAITNADKRNAPVSACCSPSPVCLMVTPSAFFVKASMYLAMIMFTDVALYPLVVNTLDRRVINRFWFLRFTLPKVLVGSIFTKALIGIFFTAPPTAISRKLTLMLSRLLRSLRCSSLLRSCILYSSFPSFIFEISRPNKPVRMACPICAEDTPCIKARSLSTVNVISGLLRSTSIFNSSTPGTCIESK